MGKNGKKNPWTIFMRMPAHIQITDPELGGEAGDAAEGARCRGTSWRAWAWKGQKRRVHSQGLRGCRLDKMMRLKCCCVLVFPLML